MAEECTEVGRAEPLADARGPADVGEQEADRDLGTGRTVFAVLPDAVRADGRVAWEAPEPKVPDDRPAPAAERREAKLAPRLRWDVPKRSAEPGQTRVFADQDLAEIVAQAQARTWPDCTLDLERLSDEPAVIVGIRAHQVAADRRPRWIETSSSRPGAGDREAFAVLVHQVSDRSTRSPSGSCATTGLAEDALQNALVLAWRRIPHLREPDRFEAWIHRILVNACYDESQRARPWVAYVRVLPVDGPSTPDGSAALADRDELERAFRRLPVDQRAVFVLHHYLGLPLVEIAEMLEIPAGTARSRLHYATRGLRDFLVAEARTRRPGRTSRMTDDRSLERAARSWIEAGPTQAPDRAVEAALLRIETLPQERDLRIPWRVTVMPIPARVAAAAVIGVLLVGGAFYMLSPGSRSNVASARRHRPRPVSASSPIADRIALPVSLRCGLSRRSAAGSSSSTSGTPSTSPSRPRPTTTRTSAASTSWIRLT